MKFKVGDEVYFPAYDIKGTIRSTDNASGYGANYPIVVDFGLYKIQFTENGYQTESNQVPDRRIRKLTKLERALK